MNFENSSFEALVPNFAVAMVILLREAILKASTTSQIQRVLRSEARTISAKRLSNLSERLFMGSMRISLGIKVTDIEDVSNNLFEAVQSEERKWNEGVIGLDEGMDWKTFGNGMGAGITRGSRPNQSEFARSDINSSDNNAGKTKLTGLEAAEYLETKKAMEEAKGSQLKSAQQLEKEFNAHIGENWNKREKAEKARIKKERLEAVRKAETDLLLSEEDRNASLAENRVREAAEREKRLAELSEKRARGMCKWNLYIIVLSSILD